jgi:murein DD-endopeptidase MepM/ murein hydrolase activator NlpD
MPRQNYHFGGIKFGAKTKNRGDRIHAACDLIAPPGTPVLAVEWGIVLRVPKTPFMKGTKLFSAVIEHSTFIARYCEIKFPDSTTIHPGMTVEEGQQISVVERNPRGGGMLHFEMYSKEATGEYSQKKNMEYLHVPAKNYQRRKDLMDPTPHLDRWSMWTRFGDWVEEQIEDIF